MTIFSKYITKNSMGLSNILCVCMHVHTCARVSCLWYVCICIHVWKPDVSFECLFELFSELLFEAKSLTVPGDY